MASGVRQRVAPYLSDIPTRSARLAVATVAIGAAVYESGGELSARALAWLTLGLLYAFWALLTDDDAPSSSNGGLLSLATAISGALLVDTSITSAVAADHRPVFHTLSAAMLVAGVVVTLRASARTQRVALGALALFTVAAVAWLMWHLPFPGLDALQFQRESAEALLRGENPYALTFRDPYPPEISAKFYGPGLSVHGVLQFGNPYMPVTTLLSLPGTLIGDIRLSSLAALFGTALLLALAPSPRGTVAAALFLLCPALPDLAVLGWSDSYVVFLLAATWYCHRRAPALLPWVAGLFFVSKQYTIVVAPAALLMLPRPWRWASCLGFAARAATCAAIVTLPMVLRDPHAFLQSAVLLQFRQPFRTDALSYLAWLRPADPSRWIVLPFLLAALTWGLIAWRHRTRRVSFPLAMAVVFLVFFAFNKQAFINYYFLVIGCLCIALADDELEPVGVSAVR